MEADFLVINTNPVMQESLLLSSWTPGYKAGISRIYHHGSGKGVNVVRILQQSGKEALLLTQSGGFNGGQFLSLCRGDGVAIDPVDSGVPIRYCHTLLDQSDATSTELVEEGHPVNPGTEKALRKKFEMHLAAASLLIITGSRAPGFSNELYPGFVKRAREEGKTVILDICKEDLQACLPYKPDFVKINLSEFAMTFCPELKVPEQGAEAAVYEELKKLVPETERRLGIRLILTHGAHGIWFTEGEIVQIRKANRVEVKNTIGCGDAATAGLASGVFDGLPLEDCVARAQEFAARNAERIKPGSLTGE